MFRRSYRFLILFVCILPLLTAPIFSYAWVSPIFYTSFGAFNSSNPVLSFICSPSSSVPVTLSAGNLKFNVGPNSYIFDLGEVSIDGSVTGSSQGSGSLYDTLINSNTGTSHTVYYYASNGQLLSSSTSNGSISSSLDITDNTKESYNLSLDLALDQYVDGRLSSDGFYIYSDGSMSFTNLNVLSCDISCILSIDDYHNYINYGDLAYVEYRIPVTFTDIPFAVYSDDPSLSIWKESSNTYWFLFKYTGYSSTGALGFPPFHVLYVSSSSSFSSSCSFNFSRAYYSQAGAVQHAFVDDQILSVDNTISQDLKSALDILQQANTFTPSSDFTGGTSSANSGIASEHQFSDSMFQANQAAITASGINSFSFGHFGSAFALVSSVINRLYDKLPLDFRVLITALLLIGISSLVLNVVSHVGSSIRRRR